MQAINKIILGTVQFGLNYGINNTFGKPNLQTVNEILNSAYDSGIKYLDTAEAYGNAHEIIGKFHIDHPNKTFEVITKLPTHIDESLETKIENYLSELKVRSLYGLLFHSYETYKDKKEAIELLEVCKQNGKIKYLGVSVYTNTQLEDVIEDKNIKIIQLPFNLFDNSNLRGQLLYKAKQKGKIIHTRSAFLQGLFFSQLSSPNRVVQALLKELNFIHQLSDDANIPLNKMCLNYCLQQSNIDNVLIGIDNLTQLKQNLVDADYSLPNHIIDKINEIHIRNVDLLNPSLWNQ